MRNGLIQSFLLHGIIIAVVMFGLPSFVDKLPSEEHFVTVEVVNISDKTNLKPRSVKPKPKPQPKKNVQTKPKPSLPEPNRKPKVTPKPKPEPAPVAKAKPVIKQKEFPEPKPTTKPEPKKAPEPKKEEKPEPKPEQEVDDFASVLKSVEQLEDKDTKNDEQQFSDVESFLSNVDDPKKYKAGEPLSQSEKGAIRQQIQRNWSLPAGAKGAQNMVVTLRIALARDGTVRNVEINDSLRYSADPFYKAMADSARRAVLKSSPLKDLPPEKYDVKDGWRDLELSFDPRDMFF